MLAGLVVGVVAGVVYADEDGFDARGSYVDLGSALVNGITAFAVVAVPLCLLALNVRKGR